MARQYWLDLFTYQTWQEFIASGGTVSGFRENRWKSVQSMNPGDYLLCYLTGISRWIGLLEITGPGFQDNMPIWKDFHFPARIPVRIVAKLEPATAVPVLTMKDKLPLFENLKSPNSWTGHFRGSPVKWTSENGKVVVEAVLDAVRDPVERPFDPGKLAKVPPILKTASGQSVTVPENDAPAISAPVSEANGPGTASTDVLVVAAKEETVHTEVQWLLAKLGNDLGLGVWVAKNDAGKSFKGRSFKELPQLKAVLPINFDDATRKTVELIDVMWLKGNAIVAAFEIESTTQIFSGLLRMADLIAMQPNLNIPLYIVAPQERRQKVFSEANRPVFAKLNPPMSEMCSFLAFEALKSKLVQVADFQKYLKPEFIADIAEPCTLDEI